jgi:hypothetical protein
MCEAEEERASGSGSESARGIRSGVEVGSGVGVKIGTWK